MMNRVDTPEERFAVKVKNIVRGQEAGLVLSDYSLDYLFDRLADQLIERDDLRDLVATLILDMAHALAVHRQTTVAPILLKPEDMPAEHLLVQRMTDILNRTNSWWLENDWRVK